MNEIKLHTKEHVSRILVGESLSRLEQYLPAKRLVILSDENVARHYRDQFPQAELIILPPGEGSKTLTMAGDIYSRLMDAEIDRNCFLLGIGGGIVCDIAGYIASTYLRGIRFGFVSTSLLAQVDASIGGKNGVNHRGYKNMIGVIRQPEFVICDPVMLKTLPEAEYRYGFAEVVKYGAILLPEFIEYLEANHQAAMEMDPDILEYIVTASVKCKCRVVEIDEREAGERKLLNFGHTFGHAFEKLSGLPHGEAVSMGMIIAARLSARLGWISESDTQRLEMLLKSFGLPVTYNGNCSEVFEVMKQDKKRDDAKMGLILIAALGRARVHEVQLNELNQWMNDLC